VLETYRVTEGFPRRETYGLAAQARRAAFSAAANIAEGSAKRGSREFRRYLDIALGSLVELSYVIRLARDLDFISVEEGNRLLALREHAAIVTWRLYAAMRRAARSQHTPDRP
jgi:four helix bundle protein